MFPTVNCSIYAANQFPLVPLAPYPLLTLQRDALELLCGKLMCLDFVLPRSRDLASLSFSLICQRFRRTDVCLGA